MCDINNILVKLIQIVKYHVFQMSYLKKINQKGNNIPNLLLFRIKVQNAVGESSPI